MYTFFCSWKSIFQVAAGTDVPHHCKILLFAFSVLPQNYYHMTIFTTISSLYARHCSCKVKAERSCLCFSKFLLHFYIHFFISSMCTFLLFLEGYIWDCAQEQLSTADLLMAIFTTISSLYAKQWSCKVKSERICLCFRGFSFYFSTHYVISTMCSLVLFLEVYVSGCAQEQLFNIHLLYLLQATISSISACFLIVFNPSAQCAAFQIFICFLYFDQTSTYAMSFLACLSPILSKQPLLF